MAAPTFTDRGEGAVGGSANSYKAVERAMGIHQSHHIAANMDTHAWSDPPRLAPPRPTSPPHSSVRTMLSLSPLSSVAQPLPLS